jgi:Acetyltransferase (GNAT) domain
MGDVRPMPGLGNWLVVRPVPGTEHIDGIGLYPFSPLEIPLSRESLGDLLSEAGLVSLVMVTDALSQPEPWIEQSFHTVKPYKTHYVVDRQAELKISKHHRREIRRAVQSCQTEVIALADNLDAWCALYGDLGERRSLADHHRFPAAYFDQLSRVPGVRTIGAFNEGELVSAHIWVIDGDRAYSHLAASSDKGYRCGASYALYDHAITQFTDTMLLDLGGIPDHTGTMTGLERFKRGFANDQRTNQICGFIANARDYDRLCRNAGIDCETQSYFPAYRAGSLR